MRVKLKYERHLIASAFKYILVCWLGKNILGVVVFNMSLLDYYSAEIETRPYA